MSSFFKNAAANMKPSSKNLDKIQVTGGSFLGKGIHDVRVEAVDSKDAADNKINITFASEDKKAFSNNYFVMSQDGTEFSYPMRLVLSGLVPDQEALDAVIALMDKTDKCFEYLTGMKTRITLDFDKRAGRFVVNTTAGGTYTVHDAKTGERLEDVTEEFATVEEARDAAKEMGYKRAYLQVVFAEATHAAENKAMLLKAIAEDKTSESGPIGSATI